MSTRMMIVASGGAFSARDRASQRILAAAVGLSLALHGAALWEWRTRLAPIVLDIGQAPPGRDALTARLVAKAAEPEPASPPLPPPAPVRAPAPEARPPVLTAKAAPERIAPPLPVPERLRPPLEPLPALTPLPPRPAPTLAPPIAQTYTDLAAYVAARRRARGEPASGSDNPEENENARRDRIVAANLASVNAPAFGASQKETGGLFQITQLGSDTAEFTFFGWNRDIKRRASQRIEVRRGSASDIRVAVVRRMIAIIREYEQEDFTWRSERLGREVRLSARPIDNEGLEHFMLRDFFGSTSALN